MSFDFQRLFESKAAHRRKLADLPIGEKLRLLDEMRERSLTILTSRESSAGLLREDPTPYGASTDRHNESKAEEP